MMLKRALLAAVLAIVAVPFASAQVAKKGPASNAGAVPAPSTSSISTHKPTVEEIARAAAIKEDIAAIEKQIGEAQAESEKYTGGLIKARIDARIAQMRYTVSLMQTRQKALELGARVTPVEIAGTPVDAATVAQLDKEIEGQRARIAENDAKAAQYSGGLIRAQILSTSATMGETLALLEQRRMMAKYGLAPAPIAVAGTATNHATSSAPTKPSGPKELALKDTIIRVKLGNKEYQEYKYDKSIFFSGEYVAEGLDKPARSIKGVFKVQDLFGETKVPIKWTITERLEPGQSASFSGKGIDYNQFVNSHNWLKSTNAADMQIVFSVESILYEDGTRRDF